MFDRIRKRMIRKRVLEQVSGLDLHLRDDIGMGHLGRRQEPVLLMARGPFSRYTW